MITAGSATVVSAIEPYSDAIIYACYPGKQGGNAMADILFGKISPHGHLLVTFIAPSTTCHPIQIMHKKEQPTVIMMVKYSTLLALA